MNQLSQIENLIIDMDGVLWHGETPMPGLGAFFATLRRLEIRFVLATNNAMRTAVQYSDKLARFGVQVAPEWILTSAETTAHYLSERYAPGTAVYVVGAAGLHEAMQARGFQIGGPEAVENGTAVSLVVVGFTPHTDYRELAMGSLLVHRGAHFVGTNPDPSFPSELGPLPGAGALLAFISTTTGVQPLTIGKPGPILFEEAVRRLGGAKEKTAMVGDRLSTDIVGAHAAGLRTIMLLSGISTRADVAESAVKPDYIFADIDELAAVLLESRED